MAVPAPGGPASGQGTRGHGHGGHGGGGVGGGSGDAHIAFGGQHPATIWPASQLEPAPSVTACLNAGEYGRPHTAS
jgi:hypothetical protein